MDCNWLILINFFYRCLSIALCLCLTTHALAATPQQTVLNNRAQTQLPADAPRLLKQMLNSEQAQHSINVILAEQGNAPKHDHSLLSAAQSMAAFLQVQEINAVMRQDISQLATPSNGLHTLVLLSEDSDFITQHQQELLTWVRAGGHLIVSAASQQHNGPASSLLEVLNISRQPATAHHAQDNSATTPIPLSAPADMPSLTRLYLENEQSPAYLAFSNHYHLEDHDNRAHAWANSDKGTHLLQLLHGAGLITLLSDLQLWHTPEISQYDHAWLLWYLSQDTEVTLLTPPTSLIQQSTGWPKHTALYSLLVLLLLGAAEYFRRRVTASRTPHLSTHALSKAQVQALKKLSSSGQRNLILTLQKEIQQRAQQYEPVFADALVAEQWHLLAQLSALPLSFIARCMQPPTAETLRIQALAQQIAHLRQLINALQRHT